MKLMKNSLLTVSKMIAIAISNLIKIEIEIAIAIFRDRGHALGVLYYKMSLRVGLSIFYFSED